MSQQLPNNPVKPPPYHVNQPVPASGGGAGRGCGCILFGCGSLLLLLIVLCGVGWYITWYTSIPLRMTASTFESSGNVKFDEVSGTISNGFEIGEMQFRESPDQPWSKIKDIKCKYGETGGGFFSSSGAAIEEVSIGSATIYGDFRTGVSGDLYLLDFSSAIEEAWEEITDEMQSNISEFRVDLVKFSNIEFRDEDDNVQFHIQEIKFSGLKIIDDQLENIGDLTVVVDRLALKTEPSTAFGQLPLARRLVGKMEPGFMNQVKQEIPFNIELGLTDDGQMLQEARWFQGELTLVRKDAADPIAITANNFSSADYLDLPEASLVPQAINLSMEATNGRRGKLTAIDSSGSFQLGQTRFDNFRIVEKDQVELFRNQYADRRVNRTDRQFLATGQVDGQTVTALVSVTNKLTLLDVQLFNDAQTPLEQLWARTAYGEDFDKIPESARNMIGRCIRDHRQTSNDSIDADAEAEAEAEAGSDVDAEANSDADGGQAAS